MRLTLRSKFKTSFGYTRVARHVMNISTGFLYETRIECSMDSIFFHFRKYYIRSDIKFYRSVQYSHQFLKGHNMPCSSCIAQALASAKLLKHQL